LDSDKFRDDFPVHGWVFVLGAGVGDEELSGIFENGTEFSKLP